MTDVIDADVIEAGTDLERVEAAPPGTLFRTDDPLEVVERASRVADSLKGVLSRQGLTQNIQGKAYVKVEGWVTLGSMLGVVPVCTWTRPVERGWEARVEARTLDGRVIGAAEAQCTRDEKMWSKRDDYALRSMAQTRATSKALRGPLGFIVTLAGYVATPAEEIPTDGPPPASAPEPAAPPMSLDRALELVHRAWAIGVQDKLQLAASHVFKEDVGTCATQDKAIVAVGKLSEAQAGKLEEWLGRKADEAAA